MLLAAATGCSGSAPAPSPYEASTSASPSPSYDAELEPAAAVLALVPEDTTTLTVTDFGEIRADLALEDVTTASPAKDRAAFWSRAESGSSMLTRGVLRPDDAALAGGYAFSQLEVDFEAHLLDANGEETGWILGIGPTVPMLAVQNAVKARVGALAGATVLTDQRLVVNGTVLTPDDDAPSWADDPDVAGLVATTSAASTYVERACVPGDGLTSGPRLDELSAYSVAFESTLATARLGVDRTDLFDRMRLGAGVPGFATGFEGGVADPATGRIGYRMVTPPAAADLALKHQLPFAACS